MLLHCGSFLVGFVVQDADRFLWYLLQHWDLLLHCGVFLIEFVVQDMGRSWVWVSYVAALQQFAGQL